MVGSGAGCFEPPDGIGFHEFTNQFHFLKVLTVGGVETGADYQATIKWAEVHTDDLCVVWKLRAIFHPASVQFWVSSYPAMGYNWFSHCLCSLLCSFTLGLLSLLILSAEVDETLAQTAAANTLHITGLCFLKSSNLFKMTPFHFTSLAVWHQLSLLMWRTLDLLASCYFIFSFIFADFPASSLWR